MDPKLAPMLDLEVEARKSREYRAARSRQDSLLLMGAWRAIARSHRLLDRDFYRVEGRGELRPMKDHPVK